MEKIGGKILLLAIPFIAIQLGASFSLEAGPKRKHDIIYTERWVVEVTDGRRETADAIASKNCFNNMGELKISSDRKFFHYELCANEKSSMRTDSPFTEKNEHLFLEPNIGLVEQQIIRPRVSKSYSVPTDPLFSTQWNVLNSGQFGEQFSGNDLNVERAWLQGYSGCNVTVAVVDDGLDIYHNDLWDNFVPQVAFDFVEGDVDPFNFHASHGTSVGGIIGSVKDNDVCGMGIAYDVNLGGLALLGAGTDMNEAVSLTFENDIVDIYSNSWGPYDDGYTVEGPGVLTNIALENGVKQGRGGKGSIYVWANGNGGPNDDCAADGYAISPYTISVGALGVDGFPSPFDEECSAKMVTAYVTNYYGSSSVTTTELGGGCTLSFGGTSAATPMVSAIIALTLEANPDLTWRDVQYLIVYTSNTQLTNDSDSITNGAGLAVSRQYGFGVMDAEAMVTRARHWVNIPSQEMQQLFPSSDSGNATFESPFYTTIQYEGSIQYLEHVVITMTVDTLSGNRGDIMIELTSPSGTMSTLLDHRDNDYSSSGFINWPFMSVMFWGENPSGEWNLTVTTGSYYTSANITGIVFKVLGVSSTPQSVANIPGTCHPNCSRGCAGEGPDTCDSCTNLRNAYTLKCIGTCPAGFTERNGYCYDTTLPLKECYSPLKFKEVGSCVDAGFSGCCEGDNCEVFPSSNFSFSCFCDVMCFKYGDCCDDISITGCAERNDTLVGTVIPYIQLGVTEGVATRTVPEYDDGTSSPIYVSFPLGSQLQSTIYVGTNGYFTFTGYSGYAPFLFYENSLPLVAPFFTDIDISSGIGQINYEVHTEAISGSILSQVNSVINEHSQTDFKGKWMLVATWDQVPPFGDYTINNTFQGILITNTFTSFAVFTYYCGDLEYSNGATIGFSSGDGLFANHPASLRGSAQSVACLNEPATPWVNVVYELTTPGGLCLSSEGYFYSDTVGECIFIGDCACSRNIECSIHGGYDGNDPLKVIPNGKVLNCLLAFETHQIDLETVEVDDTLETNHLFMSPGSLAFLENIGVAETRNDYSTCMFHEEVFSSLQSGSPAATLGEFGVETIQIQYMDNDSSFKSITLATVEFDQIIRDQNYAVDGNLSNDNACSLQHLLYWLATQPGIIGSRHSSGSATGVSGGIGEEAVGASGRGGRVIPASVSDVICRQTDTGDTNIVFPVPCI